MAEENKKSLNHEMFTNKDGYVEGGKEIETTNPAETQEAEVQGQRKRQEGEERITLDKMRAMMNQQNQDEKLEQNEELAKLRANTSIEKTILSKTLPSAKDMGAGSVIIKKEE